MRRRPSRIAVIGDIHACDRRHRPAVWAVGPLTLVDAGSLLDDCETCAVIIDAGQGAITPLGIGPHGVYPRAPGCRFETG
jgi:hypothetical protein